MFRSNKLKIPITTARIDEVPETINSRATPLGVTGSSALQKRRQQDYAMSVEKKPPSFFSNEKEANLASILRIKMKAPVHVTNFTDPRNTSYQVVPSSTMLDWSEIQRYHIERDKEITNKEKELVERRKREVKAVLDAQVREQQIALKKQIDERKHYESDLLNKCQQDVQADKDKQAAKKLRLLQEKQKMDEELKVQQNQRTIKMTQQLQEENNYSKQIKRELEEEKQKDKEKKRLKGLEAARILELNAQADRLREEQLAREHDEDLRRAEERKRQEEAEDARRQAEWDARAAKIARSMQFMANTVGKQQEEQERINAEKLRKHLEDKKRQDEENEMGRKRRLQ